MSKMFKQKVMFHYVEVLTSVISNHSAPSYQRLEKWYLLLFLL